MQIIIVWKFSHIGQKTEAVGGAAVYEAHKAPGTSLDVTS